MTMASLFAAALALAMAAHSSRRATAARADAAAARADARAVVAILRRAEDTYADIHRASIVSGDTLSQLAAMTTVADIARAGAELRARHHGL